MQVVYFNCSQKYYSPSDICSQEREFSILPNEKILIEIQPPIFNQYKQLLCVQIKNISKKIILVSQNSLLVNILKYPNIQHKLMWVDQSTIDCLKQRWQQGSYTYGYLKFAFKINNNRLGCGGIGTQCPL